MTNYYLRIIQKPESIISLFFELSEQSHNNNLFYIEEYIKWKVRIPKYYKHRILDVINGKDPNFIRYRIIHDFTRFHKMWRFIKRKRELVYTENIFGFGILYFQEGRKPEVLEKALSEILLRLHNNNNGRDFADSFFQEY